jgi:hypothetical protein
MRRCLLPIGYSSRLVRTALLAVGLLIVVSVAAEACNVPVFRYALERWRADAYRVVLFHRGPLADAERQLLEPWQEKDGTFSNNSLLHAVDVDQPLSEAHSALFAALKPMQLPWLVVRYPEHLRIEMPVWSGPFDRSSVEGLVASPIRAELIRRLAEGQTAVWLLLESGSSEADDEIAARVAQQLTQLEGELRLPELTDAPADELLTKTPLKVAFSLLRVKRDDPREQALVGMLVRAEPDLAERNDPMAFPVFGRGRALLPLIGPGITAENIRDSAAFLVGPCSCQIKELNPGFDLLLSAFWDELIFDGNVPAALVASESTGATPEPVLVPIPSGSQRSAARAKDISSTEPTHASHHASAGGEQNVLLIVAGMIAACMLVIGLVLR